jgi:hypothetical protein
MGGSGDPAKKTAEQVAMERRQRDELNEEIAASERRLKATARGKLGKRSLLGQPMQPVAAPTGPLITEGYAISGAKKDKGQMYKKPTNGRGRGTGMRTGRMDK